MKSSFPCSGQEEIFEAILLSSGAPQHPERCPLTGCLADLGCSQALSLVGTDAVLNTPRSCCFKCVVRNPSTAAEALAVPALHIRLSQFCPLEQSSPLNHAFGRRHGAIRTAAAAVQLEHVSTGVINDLMPQHELCHDRNTQAKRTSPFYICGTVLEVRPLPKPSAVEFWRPWQPAKLRANISSSDPLCIGVGAAGMHPLHRRESLCRFLASPPTHSGSLESGSHARPRLLLSSPG